MEFEVNNIEEIVELIMKKMAESNISTVSNSKNGVFDNVDEAIEEAKKAQAILFSSKLELREKIIASIRNTLKKHITELAELAVKETGMGRVADKELKNKIAIEKTPGLEDLKAFAFSGDDGLTVMELSPYGVIGAITPSTNPSETVICNSIGMIAAGNAVIFAPHPGAKRTSIRTVELINEAIKKVGGPDNLVVTIREPSIENTEKIIANPNIKMLVATGGPGVVKTVMSSGKKAIGAGAGNPPVLVDETADIEKLLSLVLKNNSPDRKYVGRDAKYLLKQIGIEVGDEIKVIIVETDKNHPFAIEELLMPILPIVKVKDALEGIKVAKELERGLRHTAVIHSKNIDILTKYAREMETTILVKNGPSYAGIGIGGEGHITFTIAGPTGEGLTSAKSFARNRRCVLVGGFSIK